MISKRQLYAMGEPLGDSSTSLKPGGHVYGGGGSGGSGVVGDFLSQAPTSNASVSATSHEP